MKQKKILIAEDNFINQKVIIFMLEKFDHIFDLADNGKIAVEKFRNDNYDLVLMDLQMPELDGFEASRMIREIEVEENRISKVKIYAMTASSLSDVHNKCQEAGINGYLSKPFKNEAVMSILEE